MVFFEKKNTATGENITDSDFGQHRQTMVSISFPNFHEAKNMNAVLANF